jgi:hypothetical protein
LEAPQGVFGVVDPKRTEPHDRVQGATDLRGLRGGNRRSREERQGRNELEAGIFEPKGGSPPRSGRAIRISMEGRLWKTPREEFELPAQVGRLFGFARRPEKPETRSHARKRVAIGRRQRASARRCPRKTAARTACNGERLVLSVSEGEVKVTRAACHWHTCSRESPEGPTQSRQDHGGCVGKANYPQPESRWRDRAAATAAVATTPATLKTPSTPERRPERLRRRSHNGLRCTARYSVGDSRSNARCQPGAWHRRTARGQGPR